MRCVLSAILTPALPRILLFSSAPPRSVVIKSLDDLRGKKMVCFAPFANTGKVWCCVLFAISSIILTPQLLSVPENLFAFQLW